MKTDTQPRLRIGRLAALPLLLAAPLLLGGCFLFNNAKPTPVSQVNLHRQTPQGTYEYFKAMAQNNQWAAEWDVFSPNFKRLVNQSVGRNVDSGDYNLARQTVAANNTSEMQMLVGSTWIGSQMTGPNRALATIEYQGRRITPRMVKLTRWELKVRDDDTPYGDFVANAADAIQVGQDGSISVRINPPQATASILRTFRPEQIEAFKVEGQWYVDDFGGIDSMLVQQAGGGEAQARPQPQPQPQPGVQPQQPRGMPYAPPPAPAGYGTPNGPSGSGSPDGPPAGYGEPNPSKPSGPQAWGSPDG
ncbi:MAG: hypothetical protein P1V36_01095 [Planctomycetota bacterium]|nr:hypothetical protein [Planctomycetota bacterium]